MKLKHIAPIMLVFMAAAFLAAPALAQANGAGPKYPKYVASLELEGVRYGQAIFNTNPEDDGTYEVEVEVEKCMELADTTVNVLLNGEPVGTIYINEYGNGKATFHVESISTDDAITVEGAITLASGDWRSWAKVKGPK